MLSYLLRDIPSDIWEGVKARAASEGRSIRWVIIELLRRYVKRGLK